MLLDITIVTVLNNTIGPFQTLHKKSLHALITFGTSECSQSIHQWLRLGCRGGVLMSLISYV